VNKPHFGHVTCFSLSHIRGLRFSDSCKIMDRGRSENISRMFARLPNFGPHTVLAAHGANSDFVPVSINERAPGHQSSKSLLGNVRRLVDPFAFHGQRCMRRLLTCDVSGHTRVLSGVVRSSRLDTQRADSILGEFNLVFFRRSYQVVLMVPLYLLTSYRSNFILACVTQTRSACFDVGKTVR
jgi:hypothetical protein